MIRLTQKLYKVYDIKGKLSREKLTYRFNVLMVQNDLNQKQLAQKVGITQQLMSHIIRSVRTGKKYRKQICKILNVSEDYFWNQQKT